MQAMDSDEELAVEEEQVGCPPHENMHVGGGDGKGEGEGLEEDLKRIFQGS